MVGVTLRTERVQNCIGKQSGVTDITRNIRESKHRWAGNAARRSGNRQTVSHRMNTLWA